MLAICRPGHRGGKLHKDFEMYGKVDKITIDEHSQDQGAFGFCFVEMPFDIRALWAIQKSDGKIFNGN